MSAPSSLADALYGVLQLCSDALLAWDAQGVIVQGNAAAAALLGEMPETLPGRTLASLFQRPPTGEEREGRLRSGAAVHLTTHPLAGQPGWTLGRLHPPVTAGPAQDEQRQQALAVMRQSAERFRGAVEQALDGVFIANQEGFFVDVDDKACALLGYSRAELVGMYFRQTIAGESLQPYASIRAALAGGAPLLAEWRLRRKDGSLITCEISAAILSEDQVLALVRDITPRKQQEEQLRDYARQLEALQAANLALTQSLHLETVLETLLLHLDILVPYEMANIMLLQWDGQLRVHASRGYGRATGAEPILTFDAESVPSFHTILSTAASLLIPDTAAFAGWIDDPLIGHVRSYLGVPLIAGGKIIGLYNLDHSERGFFTPAHQSMAEALAAQAAVAIENALIYAEAQRHANEVKSLLNLSSALRLAQSPAEMIGMLLQEMCRAIGCMRGFAALSEPEQGDLILRALHPATDHGRRIGDRIGFPTAGIAAALRRGEMCVFTESLLAPAPTDLPPPHDQPGIIGRAICAPLISQGQLIGLVEVTRPLPGIFSSQERKFLSTFAEMGVNTLTRLRFQARLEQEVEERTREIYRRQQVAEGLRYILTILNTDRPLREVLEYIVTQVCWLLDTSTGAILRQEKPPAQFRIEVAYGLPDHTLPTSASSVEPLGAEAARQVMQGGKAIAISDLGEEGEGAELAYRALLATPLNLPNETYGCLILYFTDPRPFDEEDIAIAVSFADQAALAIQNARLRAEAQESAIMAERNRLARELHDAVTQALFSASLIADVLPQIWARDPEQGRRRLEDIRRLTQGALAEMRALLLELRPKALTEVSLNILLEQLIAAAANRAQIPIQLHADAAQPLPPDVQIGLYRITQEALNNIIKHAAASRAALHLHFGARAGNPQIILDIEDDGRGFAPGTAPAHHLGLRIMQERAEAIDAALEVRSQEGKGTYIHICWPHPDHLSP
ncbi:MAG: GAF domain-containing protein [Caldilineales bacterium]|nr:GAF domain-containing protein [Caldilineales bacterium]